MFNNDNICSIICSMLQLVTRILFKNFCFNAIIIIVFRIRLIFQRIRLRFRFSMFLSFMLFLQYIYLYIFIHIYIYLYIYLYILLQYVAVYSHWSQGCYYFMLAYFQIKSNQITLQVWSSSFHSIPGRRSHKTRILYAV